MPTKVAAPPLTEDRTKGTFKRQDDNSPKMWKVIYSHYIIPE